MSEENQQVPERTFRILTQGIQDFSFENIGFGKSFGNTGEVPEIFVNVNLKSREFDEHEKDNIHKISVTIKAESKNAEESVFILDLTYEGLFEVDGFDDILKSQILHIQSPSLLFPFMRRIIADTVADAGYPPLLLDPIDFAGLHFQKQAEEEAKAS